MIWTTLDRVISLYFNVINFFVYFYSMLYRRQLLDPLKENKNLTRRNDSCIIVHNGPSLRDEDFTNCKYTDFITMNRGFLYEKFSLIKPRYHVIVDPKFSEGVWPITWIDEILSLSVDTKIVLNSRFLLNNNFRNAIKAHPKFKQIVWILPELYITRSTVKKKNKLTHLTYGAGAPGAACSLAHSLGYSDVYFCGKDGDGLLRELLSLDSHFYGNNKENFSREIDGHIRDLLMMSISLKNWRYYFKRMEFLGVNFYNTSEKGIFTFMKYKRYEE